MTDTVNVLRDAVAKAIRDAVGHCRMSVDMAEVAADAALAAAPKAEPVEADDFGDALLAFLFRHGLKVALDVSEIEALRQSAIRAQPEAPEARK